MELVPVIAIFANAKAGDKFLRRRLVGVICLRRHCVRTTTDARARTLVAMCMKNDVINTEFIVNILPLYALQSEKVFSTIRERASYISFRNCLTWDPFGLLAKTCMALLAGLIC